MEEVLILIKLSYTSGTVLLVKNTQTMGDALLVLQTLIL